MSKAPRKPAVEEDLDDLDDVLDQFKAPPPQRPAPPPPAPSQSQTGGHGLGEDFENELAAGMESLMRELSGQGGQGGLGSPEEQARDKKMREAWERMLVDELDGRDGAEHSKELDEMFKSLGAGAGAGASSSSSHGPGPEDDFQKAIKQAMDKLRNSEDTAKADEAASSSSDPFATLLSQLGDMKGLGADGEGEGDLQDMLETMMSQLMSKEILYEPLKELDTKFPSYLSEHRATLSKDDNERYQKQAELVKQIVAIFEQPTYSDENTEMSTQVLKLMNEMQSFGAPPAEIMGPMPPGFEMGEDGLPKAPDGCVIM